VIAFPASLAASSLFDRLAARDELNKGVNLYKQQKYDEAIVHFQKSVLRDPELLNARLYLATAYHQTYVPGSESPENLSRAESAIVEYKRSLDSAPKNINAIKGLAYLYLNMKQYEQAKDYYQRALDADPQDPENYYCVGVIDWTQTYQFRLEQRLRYKLEKAEPAIDKPLCPIIRKQNWENVQHGIEMFTKAIQLRPSYADAMAYLNLMYRERADIRCNDQPAYDSDLRLADEWVDKTIEADPSKARPEPTNESEPKR
jgi:tetratricopeptide (TPR) repeat protein